MNINEDISDMELADLKHKYRNDPDVSRLIAALYHAWDEIGELLDELDEDEDEEIDDDWDDLDDDEDD